MPDMAVCQDTTASPPTPYNQRHSQEAEPLQAYYNHCRYPTAVHGQYPPENYSIFQFQKYTPESSPVPQHHHHYQQQQHLQQTWDFGMGVGVAGYGRTGHGVLSEEWVQSCFLPEDNTAAQNIYNFPCGRGAVSSGYLDYRTSITPGSGTNSLASEETPTFNTVSPCESHGVRMNTTHGTTSETPSYQWMKHSAALPQAGHDLVFPGKTRTKDKYRIVYSDHQRLELEKEFHFNKYITIRRKTEVALQLGLSERQVKIWFQNRRAKERKQKKKSDDPVSLDQCEMNNGPWDASSDQEYKHQLQLSSLEHQQQRTRIPKKELDDGSSPYNLTNHSSAFHNEAGISLQQAPPSFCPPHPNYHSSILSEISSITSQ